MSIIDGQVMEAIAVMLRWWNSRRYKYQQQLKILLHVKEGYHLSDGECLWEFSVHEHSPHRILLKSLKSLRQRLKMLGLDSDVVKNEIVKNVIKELILEEGLLLEIMYTLFVSKRLYCCFYHTEEEIEKLKKVVDIVVNFLESGDINDEVLDRWVNIGVNI